MDRHFAFELANQGTFQSQLRFSLALLLFIITCPTWIWAPDRLAVIYNNLGERLSTADPKALRYLQRSAALNPGLSAAHYNLGRLLEDSYQYDLAASQYQQAIAVNRQDLRSYNNLARLLLMNGKAAIALSVLSDAPINGVQDTKTLAAIYENRASAEFDLGFHAQAIADTALSEKAYPNAAAYCLQGRIFAKTGQSTQAQVAWQSFKKMLSAADPFQTTATAECSLLAEAFMKFLSTCCLALAVSFVACNLAGAPVRNPLLRGIPSLNTNRYLRLNLLRRNMKFRGNKVMAFPDAGTAATRGP